MKIRWLLFFPLISTFSLQAFAAGDPFVGKWKLIPDKTRAGGFQEKIEDVGGYKYRFTIGDKVETIVLDGEDHPTGNSGMTWALKKIGPNKWESIDKLNGTVISTSIWTVSDDGKSFTSVTEGVKNDGSKYRSEFTAQRLSGTSGLVGVWGDPGFTKHVSAILSIEPYQGDGLSFIGDNGERFDLKFDGKEYPDKGPDVDPGTTVSAQRSNERTIELFGKIDGRFIYTQRVQVSEDGKNLALGIGLTGTKLSAVNYYARQ